MYFLIQISIKKDGTVSKGTSDFETFNDALVQFHVAMASAMTKDEIKKCTCVILNEDGITSKIEVYESLIVEESIDA